MPRIRITATTDTANAVALAKLPGVSLPDAPAWSTGESPAQVTRLSDGSALVGVYVSDLAAGDSLELDLEPATDAASSRGIDLDDQPENGRIVVNYSGFMQTIYHYGAQNFKPRFYPITVPCARLGDFDDPATVYPKSITDDSPPDHIWHRSLWYAAGVVNEGEDFYLENGGEGRIVHDRFVHLYSGPVFGGFEEDLTWVTESGKRLLADKRWFTMYRLKGALRLFDIAAEFTALDEPVTFGQTNENALPLIRVADIIDEWDGGTLTLSDGTTGSKDAFARRAEWADCTGPLVQRPGHEERWGIAMLDHPSNRNHPNAWFARSYGPLGTNLPYFDGPLTLQPAESWMLRHRIVVHKDGPFEAGLPQRFAEYADPPQLTLVTEG
ncbi:MAG TPA: PmoA family protein [Dehalococcoidia bacterium]|nr:PmoA family protein [Dehalococcoidia bacterium]